MLAREIIKKKRNKIELTAEEIEFFILKYTRDEIPDYQMAALLMAIYFNGMSADESVSLTRTMLHSGITVDTSSIAGFKVDKHSTGGVGDKTSLILGPIVAAAGLYVPMISGRGLGHTGGTLDKLESIPGFNTQLSLEKFIEITRTIGACFIGQTKSICPADKKIYALRDVTATIESLPLICASIMSKKIAEGIDGLVLDVKYGSGAFMKTSATAHELATALMQIGFSYGKKVSALLTSMDQPLGRFSGNALEVFECVEIMKNKKFISASGNDLYADTKELSLQLSAQMLFLSGQIKTFAEAYTVVAEILTSGKALQKFQQMCNAQGGDLSRLPAATKTIKIYAKESGYLAAFDVEKIGLAGIILRAGRRVSADVLNLTAGVEFHKQLGDKVLLDEVIFTIHGDEPELFEPAKKMLLESFQISLQKPPPHVLIKEVLC